MVAMEYAAVASVTSPLSSAEDYRFTSPINTNFIAGKIMGGAPRPYEQVRGEDQIYMYEAYCEMNGLRTANAETVFRKEPGIDRRWLEKPASGGWSSTAFGKIHRMLMTNTNADEAVALTTEAAAGIELETNIWEAAGYGLGTSRLAAEEARKKSAVAANTLEMDELVEGGNNQLVARNVAAYYNGIADVNGIARDFNTENATNETRVTEEGWRDDANLDYTTGAWTITRVPFPVEYVMQGWGVRAWTYCDTGISAQTKQNDDEYLLSQQLSGLRKYKAKSSAEIVARLFPTNFATAAQLTAQKAWVLAECSWSKAERKWKGWREEDLESTSTNRNMICAVEASVTFEEKGGIVEAKVSASADSAYSALGNNVDGMPEDVKNPEAPSISGLPKVSIAWSTMSWWNENSISVEIRARRIAMIIEVNWNTGFQKQ